jgi:hypothetical protein
METTVTPSTEAELDALTRDAQRYRYIVAQYARSRDLHMDGTSQWYLNTPYLGTPGKRYASIEAALDAEMEA